MNIVGKSKFRLKGIVEVFGALSSALKGSANNQDNSAPVIDDGFTLPKGFKPSPSKSTTPIPSRRHLGS